MGDRLADGPLPDADGGLQFQRPPHDSPDNPALNDLDDFLRRELECFRGGLLPQKAFGVSPTLLAAAQRSLPQESRPAPTVPPAAPLPPHEAECALRIIAIHDLYRLQHLPNLKTCIERLRTPNTIVTCAGNFVAPYVLSAIDQGRSTVDLLNRVGVTHACLGTQEASLPLPALLQRYDEAKFAWLNTNVPDLPVARRPTLPDYAVVVVPGSAGGCRKVGLLGLTSDPPVATVRPGGAFGGAKVLDPGRTVTAYKQLLAGKVDCIIPLTHLTAAADRQLAQGGFAFPVVLGGHQHDLLHECVRGQHLLKPGADARLIGVADVLWLPGDAQPAVHTQIHDSRCYPPDPAVARRVDAYHSVVTRLQQARLAVLPTAPHAGPFPLGAFLCTVAREALQADCCLVHADLLPGVGDVSSLHYLSYRDLIRECPQDFPLVTLTLPAKLISDVVRAAHRQPPSGGTLHCDHGVAYDPAVEQITHLRRRPVEWDRDYVVALPHRALVQSPGLAPLLAWAEANPARWPPTPGPALSFQQVVVGHSALAVWLQLAKAHPLPWTDGGLSAEGLWAAVHAAHPDQLDVADVVCDNLLACAGAEAEGQLEEGRLWQMLTACADLFTVEPDGDSPLLMEEAEAYLEGLLGYPAEPTQLQAAVARLDVHGTGGVARQELRRYAHRLRASGIADRGPAGGRVPLD